MASKTPEPTVKIDQIIRTQRKTIALVIDRQGRLVVRAPLRASLKLIEAFVQEKSAWVIAKQAQALARQEQSGAHQFVPGEQFLYLGQAHPLVIGQSDRPLLELVQVSDTSGFFQLAQIAQSQARSVFTAWYRRQARQVLQERVVHYAKVTGLQPSGLRITSARTRWGSCSGRGVLSFPWRLVMAPLAAVDYVVVHELVHLREKNHARAFWEGVGRILPDYQRQVAWFKTSGHRLSL